MADIQTTDDLLRILDENEEFLAAVRQKILTDELLKLPTRLELFTTQTNDSLENVKNDLRSVKNDLSILKGYGQQANLQTEMPARLANILSLRTTRILRVTDDSRGSEDFTDALKEGAISQGEYSRVLRTDLIIRAQRHTARGIDLYIVVEASYTSDEDDLDKVILSAEVLRKVFPHTEVVAALYFTHISNQDLSATEIAEVIAIRAN